MQNAKRDSSENKKDLTKSNSNGFVDVTYSEKLTVRYTDLDKVQVGRTAIEGKVKRSVVDSKTKNEKVVAFRTYLNDKRRTRENNHRCVASHEY